MTKLNSNIRTTDDEQQLNPLTLTRDRLPRT